MSFPTASDSVIGLSPAEAAKARRKAAAKARDDAWAAEIAELRARKAERDKAAEKLPIDGESGHMIGILQSNAFAEMFEDLTGKHAGEWVRSILRVSDWELKLSGETRAEQIRRKVADLAAKYFWGEPWYKVTLADKLVRCRSHTERRLLRIRMATPKWANPLKIAAIYRQRDRISEETGIPHDVDHIIPLTHPRVCGLHCEANLRVIPASENRTKSNTFYI